MKKYYLLFVVFFVSLILQGQVSQINDALMLGGRIKAHAQNANCLLVANDGGIFKTTDQGQNWTNVTQTFNPYSVNCNQIVNIGTDFYAMSNSSNGSGIYKSSNDGTSWTPLTFSSWSPWTMGKLSNYLYVVANDWSTGEGKLYASLDGNTWSPKAVLWTNNWQGGNCELYSFSQNKLYLKLGNNLYYTSDGDTMIPIAASGLNSSDFSNGDGELEGDATGNLYFRNNGVIYKYNFTSQIWTDIITGKIPADYQIMNLSVTDNAVFFSAMPSATPMKMYKSVDQGGTFTELASTGVSLAMIENIIEAGTNKFIGNDLYEGVLITSNGGDSWSLSSNQYIATFAGCLTRSGNSLLYNRGSRGLIITSNSGLNWTQANEGIPDFGGGIAYFINQLTQVSDTLFSFLRPDPFSEDVALYKSTNNGVSWKSCPIPSPYNNGKEYTFAGKCDSLLFINYFDTINSNFALIVSSTFGKSWVKPNNQNSNNPLFLKGPKNCLFAFYGSTNNNNEDFNNIYKANSFGMSFSTIITNVNDNLLIKRVYNENGDKADAMMDFDSPNNRALFAVRDQMMGNVDKLYVYNISFNQWSEINTSGLPQNYIANCIKYIGNNVWLLATNAGLYQSKNGGLNWTITHNPNDWQKGIVVNSIQKIGSKVFLGTVSNGIWVVDLSIPFKLPNSMSVILDGNQDRIRVLDNNPLNPSANPSGYQISGNSITLEAWIYPMDLPLPSDSRTIIMRPCNNGVSIEPFQTFQLSIIGSAPFSHQPRIGVSITDGIHPSFSGYEVFVEDTALVKIGQWTHVTGTYDGTNVKLYINGVLANQLPLSVSMGTGSVGLYIGGVTYGFFKGLIDEVRLWNVVRTQSEIQSSMNQTLVGNETGLVGYWPMEEEYIASNGATVTVDKTTNHNDMPVQFNAKLIDFPEGSEVIIPTTEISYSNSYAITGEKYAAKIFVNGWPAPSINIVEKPTGLTMVVDSIFWTPQADQYYGVKLSTKVSNSSGSFFNDFYIDSETIESVQNQLKVDVSNRGKLGAFGNYGKGLFYKSLNGLYSGEFSLVDRNNNAFAGGIYSYPTFCPNEGFSSTTSRFPGFNAIKTSFNDSWEANRIGVNINETIHSSSIAGDDKYEIIEYQVTNTSGFTIDDLFAQLTADFDIGIYNHNLGGYDQNLQTIYMYESDGATNPYYYGFTPLNSIVSGEALFNIDSNYVRTVKPLTTFAQDPTTVNEYRCQLNTGPYSLANGASRNFAFAIFAGDNLNDLKNSATRAKLVFTNNTPNALSDVNYDQSSGFLLEQNYPNPFQVSTQISFYIAKTCKVSLKVFDLQGKEIVTLIDDTKQAGNYSTKLDAKDLPSGMYYYQLQANDYSITKKLVLIK
ncbi:MAG: LamG-like jellyroll fold domain-containing protein [Paludibacter sp.]